MQISVVTPVYNAARFIVKSTESALAQPEVAEVILVEDASTDNSLEICQQLAAKDARVRLLRHPNGENRGAAVSRSLGMQASSCEYLAFVDADNFYLPNRFVTAKKIFASTPDCEGVYEAIGIHIFDDAGRERWVKSNRHPVDQLVTLTQAVAPEKLGEALISGRYGGLTLDGLVLKRSVLEKSGLMAAELRLHQDTDFIIRCALVARLYPGKLDEAVAMEGVHGNNRFSAPRPPWQTYQNRMAFWMSLYRWARQKASTDIQEKILDSMVAYTRSHKHFRDFPLQYFPATIIFMFRLLRLFAYPLVISDLLRLIWRQPQKMIQIIRGD